MIGSRYQSQDDSCHRGTVEAGHVMLRIDKYSMSLPLTPSPRQLLLRDDAWRLEVDSKAEAFE